MYLSKTQIKVYKLSFGLYLQILFLLANTVFTIWLNTQQNITYSINIHYIAFIYNDQNRC